MNHAFTTRASFTIPLALLLAGCHRGRPKIDSAADNRVVPVRTVAVQTEPVQRTTVQPATVHPYYRAEIRSRVSGYASELHADIGDLVSAGDKLLTLDVPELEKRAEVLRARIERLIADENRAAAGVELANAGVVSAKAKLSESRSRLEQVDASLAAAEAEFDRTEDLVQRGSLQTRMLDEVRKKRDSIRAEKTAASSSIESAKAQVTVAEAELTAAQADRAAAVAETEIARRELEAHDVLIGFATLTAPINGVVTARHVDVGDLVGKVSSGETTSEPLYVVSQIDKVRIHVPVPEVDAPHVGRGDEVTLTFPSFSDEPPMTGTVTRRSGSLDAGTRTMTVEVEMENVEAKLLPGMFGQAAIKRASQVAAHVLPSRAVRFDEDGKAYVYVVDPQQTVSIAAVEVGPDDGRRIEVVAGVEPGQRVIDAHLKRFVDGQKVHVISSL